MLKPFLKTLYHIFISPQPRSEELEKERVQNEDKALAHQQLAVYNTKMAEYHKQAAALIVTTQSKVNP